MLASINEFVLADPGFAKLVFASEGDVEKFKSIAVMKKMTVEVNTEDVDKIRSLTSKSFLIITKHELTRGVDYISKSGASLLIAAPLPHQRAFQQCLGRVGRGGTPCKRYILRGIAPFNTTNAITLAAQLRSAQKDESSA